MRPNVCSVCICVHVCLWERLSSNTEPLELNNTRMSKTRSVPNYWLLKNRREILAWANRHRVHYVVGQDVWPTSEFHQNFNEVNLIVFTLEQHLKVPQHPAAQSTQIYWNYVHMNMFSLASAHTCAYKKKYFLIHKFLYFSSFWNIMFLIFAFLLYVLTLFCCPKVYLNITFLYAVICDESNELCLGYLL